MLQTTLFEIDLHRLSLLSHITMSRFFYCHHHILTRRPTTCILHTKIPNTPQVNTCFSISHNPHKDGAAATYILAQTTDTLSYIFYSPSTASINEKESSGRSRRPDIFARPAGGAQIIRSNHIARLQPRPQNSTHQEEEKDNLLRSARRAAHRDRSIHLSSCAPKSVRSPAVTV